MEKYFLFGSPDREWLGGGMADFLGAFSCKSHIIAFVREYRDDYDYELEWWHVYDVVKQVLCMGSVRQPHSSLSLDHLPDEDVYKDIDGWTPVRKIKDEANGASIALEMGLIRKIQNKYMKTFQIRLESIVDILSRSELSHHVEKTYYPPSIHIHLPDDCPENEIPRYFEKFSEPWMEIKFIKP